MFVVWMSLLNLANYFRVPRLCFRINDFAIFIVWMSPDVVTLIYNWMDDRPCCKIPTHNFVFCRAYGSLNVVNCLRVPRLCFCVKYYAVGWRNRPCCKTPNIWNIQCVFHINTCASDIPPTKLGRYRVLSPNAGVYVSPIQLGGASIGDKWDKLGMGHMTKETSFKLLDAYYDAGGNFIDTSCEYQEGTSEEFIGEWMQKRGIRDQMVIATKYSSPSRPSDSSIAVKVNYFSNSHKSLHLAVDQSLKRLGTTYIDILYVHWWSWDSSIEEVMNNLHSLVVAGKVLYLGISDTPAWVVVKANQWAKFHGKTPFCIYQGRWNILERSFERDIIPMAQAEGLALAPFGVLAEGRFRTDKEEQRRKESGENGRNVPIFRPGWERDENECKVSKKLEEIAAEVGVKNITAVAIAYVMHKAPYVFPVIGGRKVEHLHSNIEALDIKLTPEHIKSLESVVPFDIGFPQNVIGDGSSLPMFFKSIGAIDKWEKMPAQPAQKL